MKVSELIEQLQKFFPDEEVRVFNDTTSKIYSEVKGVYVGSLHVLIHVEEVKK